MNFLDRIYTRIFGDFNQKYIQSLLPTVARIREKSEEFSSLSLEDLQKKTHEFVSRLESSETVDDILEEAFAVVISACRILTETKKEFILGNAPQVWNMIPFDVQILGGIVLHQGKIAEMKTGEGKTLVSTFAIYLNALCKKGVHVVTVNDYLAERDAQWMGVLYSALGLSVGVIKHGQRPEQKQEAYNCDITYGTNNEFGFDYLRDNMAGSPDQQMMREKFFAVIDEVDSILIDEARTPLIISSPAEESTQKYIEYSKLVRSLQKDTHYKLDEKERAVTLTEEGIQFLENRMGIDNIYTEKGFDTVHHLESALKAQSLFERDKDYIVQNDEIIIVDEFTGRLMPGRRYSAGLHQAIEAKEGVEVKRESKTLASITFQNYFRLYKKLAGMTGTAKTEAKEFGEIYRLDTIEIPTNKPIMRKDRSDAVFKSAKGKYEAITSRVKEAQEKGQPVLIGTISIEKSEIISSLLTQAKVVHSVLNAKQHEKEAEIIARAGQKGMVTVATNMAGRGTDIKLSKEAHEAGGLLVIGTERHESRRIDNQLRGRSGRQGDPGESQFFVSMDDDLLRLFGSEKMKKIMDSFGIPDNVPVENSLISKQIESAQMKVENRNFDIRKHILQYDDVMNKHREVMYQKRDEALLSETVSHMIVEMIEKYIPQIVFGHTIGKQFHEVNVSEISESIFLLTGQQILKEELSFKNSPEELSQYVLEEVKKGYEAKKDESEHKEAFLQAERMIFLQTIDRFWMDHIDQMSKLRETISLQAYANKNPLFVYKEEAFGAFKKMLFDISLQVIKDVLRVSLTEVPVFSPRIKIESLQTNEEDLGSSQAPLKNPTVHKVSSPEKREKVGRNDLCPCGSQKKYKKCCGKI